MSDPAPIYGLILPPSWVDQLTARELNGLPRPGAVDWRSLPILIDPTSKAGRAVRDPQQWMFLVEQARLKECFARSQTLIA